MNLRWWKAVPKLVISMFSDVQRSNLTSSQEHFTSTNHRCVTNVSLSFSSHQHPGCRLGCRVGSKLRRNLPSGPWRSWFLVRHCETSHYVARHAGHHDLVGTLQEIGQIIEDLRVLTRMVSVCEETILKEETQVLWSDKGNRQSLIYTVHWRFMWSMAQISFATCQRAMV